MTTSAPTLDAAPGVRFDVPPPHVQIDVEQLIVGRTLQFPINDVHGRLLLAAGQVVTPEFKRHLKQHQVQRLQVRAEDAARVTMSAEMVAAAGQPVTYDTELTRKLDTIISSGLLVVTNRDKALRDSVILHGQKAYSKHERTRLVDQLSVTSASIDGLMQGAVQGQVVDGSRLMSVVTEYIAEVTNDCDHVLSVAAEATAQGDMATHALSVAVLGMTLGIELGMDADNVRKIGIVGLVENWGMVRVEKAVWQAERLLSPAEFLALQKHPIHSLEVLERISGIPAVVPLVAYQMHERLNGSGYPRGRSGQSIHMFARILQVADAYTALTSPRPWRPAVMPYVAMEHLVRQAQQKAYDPLVVRSLLQVLSLFPIGSFITLSDASVARVIRRNGGDYAHPIVQRIQTADGVPTDLEDAAAVIDLARSDLTVVQALPHPQRTELSRVPLRSDAPRDTPH